MTKKNQDFEVYSGNSRDVRFTVTSSGSAKDLTGATIRFQAFGRNRKDSVFKSSTDTSSGVTSTGSTGGKFVVHLVPADTSSLGDVRFDHETVVTDSQGRKSTVAVGAVTVRKDKVT